MTSLHYAIESFATDFLVHWNTKRVTYTFDEVSRKRKTAYSCSFSSFHPNQSPSIVPTNTPTELSSTVPSLRPSTHPSEAPTVFSSTEPSSLPTATPSIAPTAKPSRMPSLNPTSTPSIHPSSFPTKVPSQYPSHFLSSYPSVPPTEEPSIDPNKFVKLTGSINTKIEFVSRLMSANEQTMYKEDIQDFLSNLFRNSVPPIIDVEVLLGNQILLDPSSNRRRQLQAVENPFLFKLQVEIFVSGQYIKSEEFENIEVDFEAYLSSFFTAHSHILRDSIKGRHVDYFRDVQ